VSKRPDERRAWLTADPTDRVSHRTLDSAVGKRDGFDRHQGELTQGDRPDTHQAVAYASRPNPPRVDRNSVT